MSETELLHNRFLAAAYAIATESPLEAVRVIDVATRLGLPFEEAAAITRTLHDRRLVFRVDRGDPVLDLRLILMESGIGLAVGLGRPAHPRHDTHQT